MPPQKGFNWALANLILVFLISGVLIFLSWHSPRISPIFKQMLFPVQAAIVAPVAKLTGQIPSEVVWLPQPEVLADESVNISAQSAFFVDADTGEVLFAKDPHSKLKIASLTKVMTAMVALDHKGVDDGFWVSEHASQMMPDKMYLKKGERLSLRELLAGILLVSANDAAEVLAEGSAPDRTQFVKLMNFKAKQIGMNETMFVNPSGLDNDDDHSFSLNGDQYSTSYDVALMARYAITHYPILLQLSSQPEIILPQTSSHQEYDLESVISLVRTYPGVLGLKTGYTDEANYNLITVAKNQGRTVVGVVLDATTSRDDAQTLLDQSFKKLGIDVRHQLPTANISTKTVKRRLGN